MLDTPVDLIHATVQLEQPLASGTRAVGTGFLVAAPTPRGEPRTVLITAHHVLAGMPGAEARIGYRTAMPGGTWSYTPQPLRIRSDAGEPVWTRHPDQDIAAIVIKAPPEFARAAIPLAYLSDGKTPPAGSLMPGDELMVLGYPRGLAANSAGFPILRAGRIASYPVSPDASPTFLLDFSVFPGNSGGPVFQTSRLQRAGSGAPQPVLAGILTQQVELERERLEIGVVTHARFVAETIGMLDGKAVAPGAPSAPVRGASPVSATEGETVLQRISGVIAHALAPVRNAAERMLRNTAERILLWLGPA